jgi:hypothetical protein
VTLGAERLDQVEVRSGVVPGESVDRQPAGGLDRPRLVRVKGT